MFIADLHIHSKYSRATSRDLVPEMLDLWARRKGLDLIGTGDFTHPAWRQELFDKLEPVEEGVYALKARHRVAEQLAGPPVSPRFVLSGEISSIYKKNGKVRKVHNVILLPGLQAAEKLARRLEAVGNLHSDGRPILGLDSRDLLEITLEACPEAVFIPAHIWTPHFSLFGAYSGFDAIEECFEDLTGHIHALETGLSSDPAMNWRLSALDGYALVSNSDAHSPSKLAREANLFAGEATYPTLADALQGRNPQGLRGTLEFFPEEGKYHFDGHRPCKVCLSPAQTLAAGGRCPVCGKRITVGVLHRVEELADRPEGFRPEGARPYESLVPLPEIIGSALGVSGASKRAQGQYNALLHELGPELWILRQAPLEQIAQHAGKYVAEGVRRLRAGQVSLRPGYDGEYGKIAVLDRDEIDRQISLLGELPMEAAQPIAPVAPAPVTTPEAPAARAESGLNAAQTQAVVSQSPVIAVLAGPGTGKTRTLVERIAHLVEARHVPPERITAVTFTNQAAGEMRARLADRLGDGTAAQRMTIGTFHAICLQLLRAWGRADRLLDESQGVYLLREMLGGTLGQARDALAEISRAKNGLPSGAGDLARAYQDRLDQEGLMDFDDILLRVLEAFEADQPEAQAARAGLAHLLVDEFQDINALQHRLIRAWSQQSDSLFVIGDPDQAIYGFRGSDAQCFDRLARERPGMTRIRLTENYRSTPEILACALPVLHRKAEGFLEARQPSGERVTLYAASSAYDEAVYVAQQINALVGGVDMLAAHWADRAGGRRAPSEIAVLYRTHRQAEILEQCLTQEGIPYQVAGREDSLSAPEVRELIACAAYLCEPSDGTLGAYLRLAGLREGEDLALHPDIQARLAACRARLDQPPAAFIEAWMAERGETSALTRLRNLAVLCPSLPEMLTTLSLGGEADLRRAGGEGYAADAVTLMTLHGSKGLEFPVVFLCGLKEGTLPHKSPLGDADEGEERRLLYVGMTRARQELTLITQPPRSSFLADLPSGQMQLRRAAPRSQQLKLF